MLIKANISDKELRVIFLIPNYCFKRQSCVRGSRRSERTKHNISFIQKQAISKIFGDGSIFKITLSLDELIA